MKASPMRLDHDSPDVEDIKILLSICSIHTLNEALNLAEVFYSRSRITLKTIYGLKSIINKIA